MQQQRAEITSIQGELTHPRDLGKIEERGEQIDRAGDLRDPLSGGEPSGPAEVTDTPYTSFIRGPLFALHPPIPAPRTGAVIRKIEDDGVFFEFQVFEFVQDTTHVGILIFHHGEGTSGMFKRLACRFGGALFEGSVFESFPIRCWNGPGRMGGGKRDIAEKRLVLMNLNEFQCTIGASVDNIALRSDHATVFFEFSVEVFSPMPLRIPHELIEATGHGVIGPLRSIVPLAESTGRITGTLTGVGQRLFHQIQSLLSGGNAAHTPARMVASRKKFGSRWRTNRADKKTIQRNPLLGEGINLGCGDLSITRMAIVTPASIIGEKNHDIRPPGSLAMAKTNQQQHQQCGDELKAAR